MRMKALSQRAGAWFAVGLVLALAGATARSESFAVNNPPTAKFINFKVDLQPWNAFADANKVGAPREFSRGEVIRLVVQGTPHEGYHTYPLTRQFKKEMGNASTIRYTKSDAFEVLWPPTETPPPTPIKDVDGEDYLEQRQPFTWAQDFYIKRDAKVGAGNLHFTITLQVCNDGGCHLGEHEFEVPFTIIDAPAAPPPTDLDQRLQFTPPPPETLTFQGKDLSVVSLLPTVKPIAPGAVPPPVRADVNPKADQPAPAAPSGPVTIIRKGGAGDSAQSSGGLWDLLGFMWQGVVFGAVSLLTPCVFPMIPITVSYFLKQSEKSTKPALAGAAPAGPAAGPTRRCCWPRSIARPSRWC